MSYSHTDSRYWSTVFWRKTTDYGQLMEVCQTVYDEYFVSPCHSADETMGEPHYHVIVGNAAKFSMLSERSKYNALLKLPGCRHMDGSMGYAKPVRRFYGALAYLVHLNNPEKQQFSGGLSEIVTNRPDMLDRVAKREPGFDCYAWDREHMPSSILDVCGKIASEGFLTADNIVYLLGWYRNRMELFESRQNGLESLSGVPKGVWQEVTGL